MLNYISLMVGGCMVGIKKCIVGNSYTIAFTDRNHHGSKLFYNGRVIQEMLLIIHICLNLIRNSIIFKLW